MTKSHYSMSAIGSCSRALAAQQLDYQPTPQKSDDITRLKHYTNLEAVAAQQIADLGYKLETGSMCSVCQRHGIHVEIDTMLYKLIGHLDRRIIIDKNKFPVEIKSLGKASWNRFRREQFSAFPAYAGQECAYLHAEGVPGIYWIMERDSGDSLRYVVNDSNNALNLDGFEKIDLPVTFDQIEDKVNMIELSVRDGELPQEEETDECFWCGFSYLCVKEKKETSVEDSSFLIEAAESYKRALELEKQADEMKSNAKETLLLHSKQNKIDKYLCSGLSITYRGTKRRETIDAISLKKLKPDVYLMFLKTSEPYDDFSIRRLKD